MKQRIATGLLAGLLFAAAAVLGGWYYNVLLLLLAIIGFYEYVRLNDMKLGHPLVLFAYAGLAAIVFPWEQAGLSAFPDQNVIWPLAALLLAITVVTKNKATLDGASLLLMGAVYVGFGFAAMIDVRAAGEHGLFWTALAFGCIWASDTGAYFAGRWLGRTKLWPAISPNKTVEGAIGGVLTALIVASVFALSAPGWLSFGRALAIGLAASIAGQLGDLIQSAYKRLRGVKDTGRLLPGHGGVLDRCDSWLIVFPLLVLTGLIP
ncbi:MAG: phosphatidate cytidylyltransferase [Paenibacillaceae bacterium]|jgi:phosphatidate cytidylyltransferase|nr:MAG: phosphatidate cytidylyltransferase [Paenibacillaceae bacterium]